MPGKNKLRKFKELVTFSNVFEHPDFDFETLDHCSMGTVNMKGRWNEDHFKNQHPITLELACGDADYTLEMAKRYPEKNFIAIDVKGNRMWKGATRALEQGINNAAFLRGRIEALDRFFAHGEIDEIWITFPDPFPKKISDNRRLTAPVFLKKYRLLFNENGKLHLKTDDSYLFEYSIKTAQDEGWKVSQAVSDIYGLPNLPHPDLDIKTKYEQMHLEAGKKINYLQLV